LNILDVILVMDNCPRILRFCSDYNAFLSPSAYAILTSCPLEFTLPVYVVLFVLVSVVPRSSVFKLAPSTSEYAPATLIVANASAKPPSFNSCMFFAPYIAMLLRSVNAYEVKSNVLVSPALADTVASVWLSFSITTYVCFAATNYNSAGSLSA